MKTQLDPSRLALGVLAATLLVAGSSAGLVPKSVPVTPLLPPPLVQVQAALVPPTVALNISLAAPEYVHAGHSFSAIGRVELQGAGIGIVKAVPLPFVGACSTIGVHISGGIPFADGYYMLNSAAVLNPVLTSSDDPPEIADGLDVQLTLDTAEGHLGDCTGGIQVSQLQDDLTGVLPLNITKLVSVLPLPPTPIVMGVITAQGGNEVEDQATVTTPAVPPAPAKLPITILTSEPKVTLKGTMVYLEVGPTIEDDAQFKFKENGAVVLNKKLTGPTTEVLSVTLNLTHAQGETIDTQYCFFGEYIDDGVWTTYEDPPGETCIVVAAYEPGNPDEATLLSEACRAIRQANALAMLVISEPVLVPRVTFQSLPVLGEMSTPAPGYFLVDRDYAAGCGSPL